MKVIVGLGNNGPEYTRTRHNIGFMVLDQIATNHSAAFKTLTKFKAEVAELPTSPKTLLVKPTTMMNKSGEAVRALLDFYKCSPADITVVHDEADLPFGTVRTQTGGGSAGHNGIKSIIAAIGEDFNRIRIGVANEHLPLQDTADFVLGRFTSDEQDQLPGIIRGVIQNI